MSDLGQLLRKARQENKVSLDDLQETTKIRKRYLEAIEDGNYKILPGSFYVRAFIKSYAEAVGLDPAEVLKLYQNHLPAVSPEQPAVDTIRKKRTTSTRNTDKLSRLASSIVLISFVVLIFAVIYYYAYQNYKGTSPAEEKSVENQSSRLTDTKDSTAGTNINNAQASNEAKKETSPTPSPTPTPTKALSEVTFSSTEKGVDNYTVTGSTKLSLQLNITGPECWIQVDELTAENKKVPQKSKLYKSGETETFELSNSAYLNIGAASNVRLTVNGKDITVGDLPNPKKVQLNLQKS